MNIVFLGSGAFGLPALEGIRRAGHAINLVVSQPDRPAGRGRASQPTPVTQYAREHRLESATVDAVNDPAFVAKVAAIKPDCLVVIAFGQKLSDPLLATARHGGINLHASLLPRHRGAAPIHWAIINGDAVTGVSVIEVTNVMDGGGVFAVEQTAIGTAETAGDLHDRLAQFGGEIVPRVLAGLSDGTARAVVQDAALRSPAPKLSREMAWVDFTQSANAASARIRGLSPWPAVAVQLFDPAGAPRVRFNVLRCEAVSDGVPHETQHCARLLPDLTVACGEGALMLLEIQIPGKRAMTMADLANGYRVGGEWRVESVARKP